MLRKADDPFICMFPCGGIGPPCICIGGCDPFPELEEKYKRNFHESHIVLRDVFFSAKKKREKCGKRIIYLDASLDVEVADYSFDSQVPWMDSSYFAEAGSALDDLDNAVVAYIDWGHFALHDVDAVAHDSSYHFDTLFEYKICVLLVNDSH